MTTPKAVSLHGEVVHLRPVTATDAARLTEILTHPEVAQWWGRWDLERVRREVIDPDDGTVIFRWQHRRVDRHAWTLDPVTDTGQGRGQGNDGPAGVRASWATPSDRGLGRPTVLLWTAPAALASPCSLGGEATYQRKTASRTPGSCSVAPAAKPRLGDLLSSDDFGSSVARDGGRHPLCRVAPSGGALSGRAWWSSERATVYRWPGVCGTAVVPTVTA